VVKSSWPCLAGVFLLRKKIKAATKQHIPITPIATAIPMPAFAPLLSPPFTADGMLDELEALNAAVLLDEVELDVLLGADIDVCAALDNELVDELAKFQPLIWTP